MGVSAAILAGGKNLRMEGKNKAFLQIGGRRFIERIIERLRPLFTEIMIIGNDTKGYAALGLPVYPDIRSGAGSLGGIHTALCHSPAPHVFCVACDMPFLHPGVISYLRQLAEEDGWDIVVPRLPEGLEPLCAVYSRRLIPRIEKLFDHKERRIRSLMENSRIRYVDGIDLRRLDPDLLTFVNINTPADLERAQGIRDGEIS